MRVLLVLRVEGRRTAVNRRTTAARCAPQDRRTAHSSGPPRGACRNVYSKARRAAGGSSVRCLLRSLAGEGSPPATLVCAPLPVVDRLDVPRSRDGLTSYYRLLATTTDAVSHSGGRWLEMPIGTLWWRSMQI